MFKTTLFALAAAAISLSAAAQERTIITSAPTADEYVDYLFKQPVPAQIKTRGIPTRGIQMTGAASVAQTGQAAPAAVPAPQQAAAPAQPEPQPTILAAPVNFDLDSAAVPTDFAEYLVNLAEAMKRPEAAGKLLIISGHTDSQGSDAYNLELSMRRADAIETFLLQRGVSPSQLVSTGKGERDLIAGREMDHAVNRRVEFKVAG